MNCRSTYSRELLAVLVLLGIFQAARVFAAEADSREKHVASAERQFAMSCANAFCHGSQGRAGRGPRLRGRDWDKAYLYQTIEEGIPGTSMPGWRGTLSEEQIADVVQYILSISHELPAAAKTAGVAPSIPVASGSQDNIVARGKELFSDPSRDRNCSVCHQVAGIGGSIGPPLDKLINESDAQIMASIGNRLTGGRSNLLVRTATGESICGINSGGDDTRILRIYDLGSAGPPVLRSFSTGEIAERGSCDKLDVHAGLTSVYTHRQLAEIVDYLKSSDLLGK